MGNYTVVALKTNVTKIQLNYTVLTNNYTVITNRVSALRCKLTINYNLQPTSNILILNIWQHSKLPSSSDHWSNKSTDLAGRTQTQSFGFVFVTTGLKVLNN